MKSIMSNVLLLLVGSIWTAPVFAEAFTWRGFVAQGLIKAEDSNFVEEDGESSLQLTEFGLNGNYRISPTLRVAGQGVYINGGNRFQEGARLDYLFLDWRAMDEADWKVNFHLGRFKNYNWLYSATRDVPHTRPSIILPQSVYFDVFRDVALGSDGLALLVDHYNEYGDWELIWTYGTTKVDQEQTRNLLGNLALGDLEQDFAHLFSVFWRPSFSNVRFGISLLDSDFTYQSAQIDNFVDGEATSQRFMLNALYSSEMWELAVEYMRERVIYNGVVSPTFFTDNTAEGGYVQGRYFISQDITLLARLDMFDRDRRDRSGQTLVRLSNGTVPAYFSFMDQATLGLSWDIAPDWRLQAEYHRVKGRGRLAPVLVPDLEQNHSKYWNIWAVQFMHWF